MVTFAKQERISIDGTPIAIALTEGGMVFLGSPKALGKLENPRQVVSEESEDGERTLAAVRTITNHGHRPWYEEGPPRGPST